MRGHVISRGPVNPKTGKHEGAPYTYVVELGEQPAQRCPICVDARGGHRLHWVKGKPLEACPNCGGEMETIRERRQKTKGGYLRKKDAQADLEKQLVERREGTYREPSLLTVQEYLTEKWLPAIQHTIKPSTYASYQGHVTMYLIPHLGQLRLRDLEPADVNALYSKLANTLGGRGGACLSAKTRRLVHITLRKALGDAVRWRLVPFNAAADADPPRVTRQRMQVWTRDDLRAFLDHVAEDRLFAMWRTFAMSGLRRGEVLGLLWKHVDFDHAVLNVEQSRVNVGYEVVVSETKTGRGRAVSLDARTMEALAALELEHPQTPEGYVFTDDKGEPLHPDRVTKLFDDHQAALRAYIVKRHRESGAEGDPQTPKRIRLHDLRHTRATHMLQAGVHPKVVQEILGHATISTTMDIYSHVMPGMQESAAEMLAALLDGD